MYGSDIYFFGSKIFDTPQRDAISSLPLELSWKIFSYLDSGSLRNVNKASKIWERIIMAHKTLRKRLNLFELGIMLGSKKLAKYYNRSKKLLKKRSSKNYLAIGEYVVEGTTNRTNMNTKRSGDNISVPVKRFKLF